jgi:hypothetical protein
LKARSRLVEALQHLMLQLRVLGARVIVRTKAGARVAPDANGLSAMKAIRDRHSYSDSDRDSATHNAQRSPDAGSRAPHLQYDERKGKN